MVLGFLRREYILRILNVKNASTNRGASEQNLRAYVWLQMNHQMKKDNMFFTFCKSYKEEQTMADRCRVLTVCQSLRSKKAVVKNVKSYKVDLETMSQGFYQTRQATSNDILQGLFPNAIRWTCYAHIFVLASRQFQCRKFPQN